MILKQSPKIINQVAAMLKRGGVIIVPTDTVYGFIADASNKKAVTKIYTIKKRAKSKPLSLFVKNIGMAKEIAEVDARQLKMLKKKWPGKYTFILKRKSALNSKALLFSVHGVKKESVAVRIPKHAFLQKLLKEIDMPLVQTSANLAGQEPLNSIADIATTFGKSRAVALIIDGGAIKKAKASKIIDLTQKKVVTLR